MNEDGITGDYSFSEYSSLKTVSGSSTSVTVYKQMMVWGSSGKLTAKSGSKEIASINLTPCPQLNFQITTPWDIYPGNSFSSSVVLAGSLNQHYLSNYRWTWYFRTTNGWVEEDVKFGYPPQSASMYVNPYEIYYGSLYIEVKCVGLNNITKQKFEYLAQSVRCEYCQFGYRGGGGSNPNIAYPNPVSDILHVDLDELSSTGLESITDGRQLKQDKTFDVRLYDGQGNMVRQQKAKGGTVQFNVSNLPGGTYYLHIYDGVGEKPEMIQVIVEH